MKKEELSKYEIIYSDSIEFMGFTLYRIRALKDFSNVNSGDLGGYICDYENLSQYGDAWVSGDAKVYGNARVCGQISIITILDIGRERGCLTMHLDSKIGVRVTRGCFTGTIEEFLSAVEKTHGDNMYGKIYRTAIEMAKIQFEID